MISMTSGSSTFSLVSSVGVKTPLKSSPFSARLTRIKRIVSHKYKLPTNFSNLAEKKNKDGNEFRKRRKQSEKGEPPFRTVGR